MANRVQTLVIKYLQAVTFTTMKWETVWQVTAGLRHVVCDTLARKYNKTVNLGFISVYSLEL